MDLGLDGKVALVTGGSKGIGFGIASGLAAEGARVAVAARNADRVRDAAERIGGHGVVFDSDDLDAEDWSQAERLAGPLADQLRLMADVGWQSDDERQHFELTMPEDQLAVAVMWLHEFAAGAMHAFLAEKPDEGPRLAHRDAIAAEAFGEILGHLPLWR